MKGMSTGWNSINLLTSRQYDFCASCLRRTTTNSNFLYILPSKSTFSAGLCTSPYCSTKCKLSSESYSKWRLWRGCPQGEILHPLRWNLLLDDITILLNDQGYVDNLTILTTEKHPGIIIKLIYGALKMVEE